MSKLPVFLVIFTVYIPCTSINGITLRNPQAVVLYQLSSHRNFTSNFYPIFNYKEDFQLSILLPVERNAPSWNIISGCSFYNLVPNHVVKNDQQFHLFPLRGHTNYYKTMEYLNKLHYKYPKFLRYINRKMKLGFKRTRKDMHPSLSRNPNVNPILLEAILPESFNFETSQKHRTLHDPSKRGFFSRKIGLKRTNSLLAKLSKDSLVKSKSAVRETRLLRTRRRVQENEDTPVRVRVRFRLEKQAVFSSKTSVEFSRHLKMQLAKRMRVPLPSIQDLEVSGTDVSFTVSSFNDENNVMDDQTVVEAADFFRNEVKLHRLRLTDLQGQVLLTTSGAYVSTDENPVNFSFVILVVLGVTILLIIALIIMLVYLARRLTRIPRTSERVYRRMDFGRDSSQSVGKYSLDSGLWLGPGPEPTFTVPDAPYYRPPTVDQIASTPRPVTSVRTRLKTNWNVDERALSTIPDDHGRRPYMERDDDFS